MPSIQLGTLTSVLRDHAMTVTPFSMFLTYMDFMRDATASLDRPFTTSDYYFISEWSFLSGMGDWVFAGAPYQSASEAQVAEYVSGIRRYASEDQVAALLLAREFAPRFLEAAADAVLRGSPDVVGFTSTFAQNVPSLALARVIKEKQPNVTIVFGGANCEGIMGEQLIKSFDWIDYIVRGEGEYAFPQLIDALSGEGDAVDIPGLCFKRDGKVRINEFQRGLQVKPDDIPCPDYDEYFALLARSKTFVDVDRDVRIPIESSRGCWWGEKHHCTFCGLNGLTMNFRSKSPKLFLSELMRLGERYGRMEFHAADNIIDNRYFKTFVPDIIDARSRGLDFTFFYETKANLKKEQVAALAAAGIHHIQPGIESLSTNILRAIDKGVTAIQNIALLKWAHEYGIAIEWNLIYGLAGETDDDWRETAELIPRINHLEPPKLTQLLLERFSPYFSSPERFGIVNTGPKPWYSHLYPLPSEDVANLVYYFDYTIEKHASYQVIEAVGKQIERYWTRDRYDNKKSTLTYTRGVHWLKVFDRRAGRPPHDYVLRGALADVLLAADSITNAKTLHEQLPYAPEKISEAIERLIALDLMIREGEKLLSLPTSTRPMSARMSLQAMEETPVAAATAV